MIDEWFNAHGAEKARIQSWLKQRYRDAWTTGGIEERMLSGMTAAGRRKLNETLRQFVENLSTS